MIDNQESSIRDQFLFNTIRLALRQILSSRLDVTILACKQRAKFEGWLKFELASALNKTSTIKNIILEGGYATGGRADIVFTYCDITWFIEMKTSNTNWRAEGIENRTRPIKKNIDEVIDDIKVLQSNCYPHRGLAVFVLFPVPKRIWTIEKDKVSYHLHRIESDCDLRDRSLMEVADYIIINDQFGMCTFLVAIQ